nr:prepilin-type N-terminal cleavage/methylation domain-containing protein [Pedobacter panaciterrae]
MAKLIANKVKASTLLEVIVAMVIIMIVFVIATGIYTNVIKSSPSIKQQQARALASGIIQQSTLDRDWTESSVQVDSITLQKEVLPYEGYADLILIRVTAKEQGKEIGIAKQIVKRVEDEPK